MQTTPNNYNYNSYPILETENVSIVPTGQEKRRAKRKSLRCEKLGRIDKTKSLTKFERELMKMAEKR